MIIYLNWNNNSFTRDALAESGEHFVGRTKTQMLFGKIAARVSNQEPVGAETWTSGGKASPENKLPLHHLDRRLQDSNLTW
jgi:hypothetical protein